MYPYEVVDKQAAPHDSSRLLPDFVSRNSVSDFLSRNATPLLTIGAIVALSLPAYRIYQSYTKPSTPPGHSSTSAGSQSTYPASSNVTTTTNVFPTPSTITASTASSSSALRLGSRTSQLAMWQARHVASLLASLHPSLPHADVVGMNTTGDIDQIKPLTSFDSKGVFTKELDVAVLASRIDAAVHCMKDLPTTLPAGLVMAAVLERGQMSDALIVSDKHIQQGRRDLASLPAGSVIGTSALRRRATVARYYGHLSVADIRGNVNTRLAKLDRGEFDAIILAAVGLRRIGLDNRITMVLDDQEYGYAVGQGALAVLAREGDAATLELLAPMNHLKTALECEAERALLRALQGGCKVPITVRSTWRKWSDSECELCLWSAVLSVDGRQSVEFESSEQFNRSTATESQLMQAVIALGERVGHQLRATGAEKILADIR